MANEIQFLGLPTGLTATARGRLVGGTATFTGVALTETPASSGDYVGPLPGGLTAGLYRAVMAAGGQVYASVDVRTGADPTAVTLAAGSITDAAFAAPDESDTPDVAGPTTWLWWLFRRAWSADKTATVLTTTKSDGTPWTEQPVTSDADTGVETVGPPA